jgi:Uncharacterized conserved protein
VQRLGSSSFRPFELVLLNPAFAFCPRSGLVCSPRERDRFGCSRGGCRRPPLNPLYQMPPIPKRVEDRLIAGACGTTNDGSVNSQSTTPSPPRSADSMVALMDYKNLQASGCNLSDALVCWLQQAVETNLSGPVVDVYVRTYGAWFDGTAPSEERTQALLYYQAHMPSLFAVGKRMFRAHLRFAEGLVSTSRVSSGADRFVFTHTSVVRPSEVTSAIKKNTEACTVPSCRLADVRRWISRRKACLEHGCPSPYSKFFERREQKQVDVHIAVDLLESVNSTYKLALVSADNDFLPALMAFASRGDGSRLTWIRPHGEITYMDAFLRSSGITITNL